jgi:hypothetical protein
MQALEFVPADSLIASIQDDLSSFDSNNQLDPGRWYPWIQKIVADLGIACLETKHALVWVKNYQGTIECDFYILDSAFLVNTDCAPTGSGIIQYQGRSIIWDDTTTACAKENSSCPGAIGDCDFRTCSLNEFNEVTVREYVMGLPYTYTIPSMFPLYVNQRLSKGWCLPKSICFGSNNKHEINIDTKTHTLFTNFCDGIVLLNYYAYPYDENGLPLIPNTPKIKLAIEHYIKWKALEKLWVNNDDMGVQQKMMYFKNEFEQNSYPDAEYVAKLTSMSEMMDMARNARHRFDVFQLTQK